MQSSMHFIVHLSATRSVYVTKQVVCVCALCLSSPYNATEAEVSP